MFVQRNIFLNFILLFSLNVYCEYSYDKIESNCILETNQEVAKKAGIQNLKVINKSPNTNYIYQTMKEICLVRNMRSFLITSNQNICPSHITLPDCFLQKIQGKFRTISAIPLLLISLIKITNADPKLKNGHDIDIVKINMISQMLTIIETMINQPKYVDNIYAHNTQQEEELRILKLTEKNILKDTLIKYDEILSTQLSQLEIKYSKRSPSGLSDEGSKIQNLKARIYKLRAR